MLKIGDFFTVDGVSYFVVNILPGYDKKGYYIIGRTMENPDMYIFPYSHVVY